MGRHTGQAAESKRREMMYYVGGTVATSLIWAALVSFTVKLGTPAKQGSGGAWLLIVIASLGAIACLILAILLGTRAWELRAEIRPPQRSHGGRRAKR